ncbi:MAG: DUF1679 domain-containing protein [Caldilineaceae bacterium]|nr:DUF1679 domain-containing protein [Caldilineaceae bacterium]
MRQIFTTIDQITPAWLTQCLHAAGALPEGRVLAVHGQLSATITATVGRVTVHYSADASPLAPLHLFLKTGIDDSPENDDMAHEVRFYQQLAGEVAEQTVRCYDAQYASHPARFHLLLADMSATHTHAHPPLPPTFDQLAQAVDCLAGLHAYWWDHPRFAQEIQPRYRQTEAAWCQVWEAQLAGYLDFLGERLSNQRRTLYQTILPQVITLLVQREQSGRHRTLIHQDAHAYNFLFPADPVTDQARLVDWATWDVGVGARDLAYLIALFFFPEQRARLEQPLLQRYLDGLVTRGVRNYPWEQLWDDYRLSVIANLFVPVEQFTFGVPAHIWWLHAERSFLAFADLNCAELLALS